MASWASETSRAVKLSSLAGVIVSPLPSMVRLDVTSGRLPGIW